MDVSGNDSSDETKETNGTVHSFSLENGHAPNTPIREGPKAVKRQFYAALSAHLGAFIMATVWSWSSTALPYLRQSEDLLGPITIWDEAWIASITFLAGGVGSFAMGALAQRFGLKTSLIIETLAMFVGWVGVAMATSLTEILIGRFITGFFVAGVGVSTSLIAELSSDGRRGRLNFIFDLMFCAGVLFIYLVGTFFTWKVQAWACSGVTVVFFGLLLTLPESPVSSQQKRQDIQSKKALRWARDRENVEEEWNVIRQNVANLENSTQNVGASSSWWEQVVSTYFTKQVMKPIFLAIALQFFLQVCGVVPIVCYAVDVFKSAGTEGVHENVSTIVLGLVNLIATIIAFFFVDKFGRRFLMILSELFLTITLGGLAAFLYMRDAQGYFSGQSWAYFPLVCFVVFITFYSFGVGPLPWVLMGEILSPNAKGFSSGVVILAARAFGFLVMFFFKDMILVVGQHGVYLFFAGVCFCGLIFSYFFIPETRKRNMEDIQTDIQQHWFFHRVKNTDSFNPSA